MIVGLLACCSKKDNIKTNAVNLYKSSLFIKSMNYLKKRCNKIYILSAKYGLLELNEEIEPYNVTLNKMNKQERIAWTNMVLKQLKSKTNLVKDNFIIIAGIKYREELLKHLNNYSIPTQGLGLGRQLQFLNDDENNK